MVGPWVVRPCLCVLLYPALSALYGGALGCATLLLRFVVFPLCWWGLAHVRFTTLCSCGLRSRALSFLCCWGPGTTLRSSLVVGLRCVYDLRPCAFLICLLFAGGPLAFLVPFCVVLLSLSGALLLLCRSAPLLRPCVFLICLFLHLAFYFVGGPLAFFVPFLCPAFLVWRSFVT